MRYGLFAALLFCLFGSGVQASPSLNQLPEPNAPVQPKKVDPLAACSGAIVRTGGSFIASFANGSKFEAVKGQDGLTEAFTYTAPNGEQKTERVSDFADKIRIETPAAPDEVKKTAAYTKLRHKAFLAYAKILSANCERNLVDPRKGATPLPGTALKLGGTVKPMEGEDEYWDSYNPWLEFEGMGYDDFVEYSGDMVEDVFYSGMEDFAAEQRNRPPVQCREAVNDCQATCSRIGMYGGGVACTALGGAAGFFLSPPIGLAVGAYCGGKVFVATEECRNGCQVPVVTCNW